MREQRKAWAWGWQPVCNKGLQSSERGTTSPSRLLWPRKLGSRISEYPTSLQTFIWLGMATQRVDWPMSNPIRGYAIARRVTEKNTAILKGLKNPESPQGRQTSLYRGVCPWMALQLLLLALYTARSASPSVCKSVINYLSKTERRCVWRQRLVLWWLQTERGVNKQMEGVCEGD